MPVFFKEGWDRELNYSASGGSITVPLTALGSTSEAEVFAAALVYSPPYFEGLIRNDCRVRGQGGPVMSVEIQYGTTGVGGGDQPLGGVDGGGGPPANPTGPANDTTPLTSGYSFRTRAPRIHITQSISTISATRRGAGAAKDFKQAINVGLDGRVEGLDLPASEPRLELTRTVARGSVDHAYLRTIKNLAGKTNTEEFYCQPAGSLIYLGASGQYTEGEGWSITHEFGGEENQINITLCDGLVVPAKKGSEYVWIAYEEVLDNGLITTVPAQANVEQVVEAGNFALIEIGV